jgi:hypothetical protein
LTNIFANELRACGDRNVLHGVSAIVAEAWGLDRSDFEAASEFVND